MQFQTPTAIASLQAIPSGAPGVRETLRQMSQVVRAAVRDPRMAARLKAMEIVRGLPDKAWRAEMEAIYYWVNENIRFVKDIRGVETIQFPAQTLEFGQGDCDDQAVLIASLLESIGHPTRFVAVGFKPGLYSHVLAETKIGKNWIPLETTEPSAFIGWFPPRVVSRMVHHN